MTPKVSVIIPVYNAEDYLRQCLDSVCSQTLQEIEIICVDDGSADQSLRILKEYAAKDSRISVLEQENAGAGAARNKGLAAAEGTYLSFLDSDDFFEPEMLEKAVGRLEEDQADFVVFRCDQYLNDQNAYKKVRYTLKADTLPPYRPFTYNQITGNIFRTFVGWAWDKVYRREFVQNEHLLFQEQRTSNDLLFVFSALTAAKRITWLDEVLAHQRRNNKESLSATREKSWFCFYDALCALRDYLKKNGIYDRLERDFINYAVHFSLWNLNTIAGSCRELLYSKLHKEWLKDLGITDRPSDYFYDAKEYCQIRDVCDLDFQEYETKISVVIPVHNAQEYIRQCLDSILTGQGDIGLEVICVDDCSTDATPEILEEYRKKYPNFRCLRNEKNLYAGPSRNRGLEAACGQYVHFVDSDDYVEAGIYRKLYPIAREYDLDWLKTTAAAFDDETGREVKNPRYSMERLKRGFDRTLLDFRLLSFQFLECMSLVPWNGIYKRSFLMDNKIRFNDLFCVNDRSFFAETCVKGRRVMVVRHCIVQHRTNVKDSLVAKRAKHFDCQFRSYEIMKKICDENAVSAEVRYQILEHEMYDMFNWFRQAMKGPEEPEKEKLRKEMQEFVRREVDISYYEARKKESRWLKYRDLAGV